MSIVKTLATGLYMIKLKAQKRSNKNMPENMRNAKHWNLALVHIPVSIKFS